MQPYQLAKQEIKNLNQGLTECELIKQDLERAKAAGVPNVEHIEEALSVCVDRINSLLQTYNPKGKK